MKVERASLGEISIDLSSGSPEPVIEAGFTDLDEYSRFKYGDGEAAHKYGSMLGHLMLEGAAGILSADEVYVASSAYRFAPPASEGLLAPFLHAAEKVRGVEEVGPQLRRFKIGKAKIATDGYADMTYEERRATVQGDLILPGDIDLSDKIVIMLDDVRVTGLREEALHGLLEKAGVALVRFGYVLNVANGQEFPRIERTLNRIAVKTVDDVINLAQQPGFIPNIRMCKFITAQSPEDFHRFCAAAPEEVLRTVMQYISSEDLENVIKIVP